MTKIPFLQPWKVSMCRIKHASAVKIGDSLHSGCFNIQMYLLVASSSEKACQTYLWNPWKRLESIACQVGILAVSRRWPTWHSFLRLCCLPCFLHTQARPLIASIGYTSTVHCPLPLTSFNNFKKMSRAIWPSLELTGLHSFTSFTNGHLWLLMFPVLIAEQRFGSSMVLITSSWGQVGRMDSNEWMECWLKICKQLVWKGQVLSPSMGRTRLKVARLFRSAENGNVPCSHSTLLAVRCCF